MTTDQGGPEGTRALRLRLGLSQVALSRVLEVSARTVQRWERIGAPPADAAILRRFSLLADVSRLATEAYGEDVEVFMRTPRRSLAMRSPREALVKGDLEAVRQTLIGVLEGAWA